MLGSQALETAIGLALLFFILATATSAVVELVSKIFKKRHRDLEQAIGAMLKGEPVEWASGSATLDSAFRATTVYRSAQVAAGKAGVTYLSAKSFADAAVELYRTADNVPANLSTRMEDLFKDVGADLVRLKAGLESWFDETMASLESQYKKWATAWLFFVGLTLAVVVNASALDVAKDLWNDEATRAAVVAAAESTVEAGQDASKIEDVARTTSELEELSLPVGWSDAPPNPTVDPAWWLSHVIGWILTGALLMLGAPFWFDLLSRLVSLRNSGKSPDPAPKDDASATAAVIRAEAATGNLGTLSSGGSSTSGSPSPTLDSFLGRTATTTSASSPPDVPSPPGGAKSVTRRLAGRA